MSSTRANTPRFDDDSMLAKLEEAVDDVRLRSASKLTVAELMTTEVATCHPGSTAESVAQIMWERRCGCVPVIDEAGNHPIAVITDRDIAMAAYIQGQPLSRIAVSSAMSSRIFTIRADESLTTAERIMKRHGIRRLPVVDASGSRRLIGIITLDDIANRGDFGPVLERNPLSAHAIAETVAGVGHAVAHGADGTPK